MPLIESFSGIRGIYDDGLDERVAERYAYSYFQYLKNKHKDRNLKIVIGTDTRQSKDILKNSFIEALDCDIIDLGIASTPMAEFAVRHFKSDGGVIITASHNEPYWNGFKFLDNDGAVLRPKDMEKVIALYNKLKTLSDEDFFDKQLYNKNKKYEEKDTGKIKIKKIYKAYNEINNAYSDYILNFLSREDKAKIKDSGLKIIIDPNGGTGIIAKPILEKLGVKVHGINMKHGVFNRVVEPNEDSLLYLSNEVRDRDCDFAAGFDCDADRVEIMTLRGLVSGNHLLALIADDILKDSKNKAVVANDATSGMVRETAKKHNANYIETQAGEINVVDKMYELKAPVGGEGSSSGVIIPPSRCRDGILTLIYLLKILAERKTKLESLIKSLPAYCNIKRKVKVDSGKYNKIKGKLAGYYAKKQGKIRDSKDGSLKIFLNGNSFIWFRTSKTEADVLRVIADSPEKEQAESIMEEALGLLESK
ncbi:hypothetical protein KY347_00695 [Candidatus Woesearchaeota archaeon]|nr:hypothetical protein [Candidatus Woesearchaeota archaeon]